MHINKPDFYQKFYQVHAITLPHLPLNYRALNKSGIAPMPVHPHLSKRNFSQITHLPSPSGTLSCRIFIILPPICIHLPREAQVVAPIYAAKPKQIYGCWCSTTTDGWMDCLRAVPPLPFASTPSQSRFDPISGG